MAPIESPGTHGPKAGRKGNKHNHIRSFSFHRFFNLNVLKNLYDLQKKKKTVRPRPRARLARPLLLARELLRRRAPPRRLRRELLPFLSVDALSPLRPSFCRRGAARGRSPREAAATF